MTMGQPSRVPDVEPRMTVRHRRIALLTGASATALAALVKVEA